MDSYVLYMHTLCHLDSNLWFNTKTICTIIICLFVCLSSCVSNLFEFSREKDTNQKCLEVQKKYQEECYRTVILEQELERIKVDSKGLIQHN